MASRLIPQNPPNSRPSAHYPRIIRAPRPFRTQLPQPWRDSSKIWAALHTGSPNVEYRVVKDCPFTAEDAATALGWELFDVDAELSEKFAQGSSVKSQEDASLRFGIKAAEDVSGPTGAILHDLLRTAWSHHAGEKLAVVPSTGRAALDE